MTHHQTIHDRLVAGLCALGYEQISATTRKYTVLEGRGPEDIRVFAFVGKSGALRLNSRLAATTSWVASPKFRARVELAEARALVEALGATP